MPDLFREEVAAFVAALKRSYMPLGLVTPAVTHTIAALQELAVAGGVLAIATPDDEARLEQLAAAAQASLVDDDIPF